MNLQQLNNTYDRAELVYRLVWQLDKTGCMNFGYCQHARCDMVTATRNLLLAVAREARVADHHHVLDAGSGYGGNATMLAQHFGCHVTGVTGSERQCRKAAAYSERQKTGPLTRFVQADYHQMPFTRHTFDRIISIEAIFHSQDKATFFREAWRVLKPGGHMVFTDYVFPQNTLQGLQDWVKGYYIGQRHSLEQLLAGLQACGFAVTGTRNLSAGIIMSSARLYRLGKICQILLSPFTLLPGGLQKWLPVKPVQAKGAVQQYTALKSEKWQYFLVSVRKPA